MLDKRTIERILYAQKAEIDAKRKRKHSYRVEENLIELDSPQAQVVIGVRRSGKSTLCFQALESSGVNYAYINFDDEEFATLETEDLNNILEVLYTIYGNFKYLFLDEIQNVTTWYLFVNRLLRQGIHIVITGSNAKLLSGELATHLTGRSKEIILYPFSFREYCELKKINNEPHTTKEEAFTRVAFDNYLREGGFPELFQIKDKRKYIQNLVDNIIKRDIIQRHNIRFEASFEKLANHLLNISPAIIVDKKLVELFEIKSEHTVKNYINFLKQAYILVALDKYSTKSKLRLVDTKLYPIDVALMSERENAFSGENLGWRLEVVVYLELMRRYKNQGFDIYYFKERSGECDFVVCKNNKVLKAIQVSYDISNIKTKKRELSGLVLASNKTNCQDLLLLTDHQYEDIRYKDKDIKIRPVYSWTLEKEYEIKY